MTILVIAEYRQGELRDVSFELVTAGSDLAAARDEKCAVGVVGGESEAFGQSLSASGVDTVYTIEGDEEFNHGRYVQSITQLCDQVDPSVLLMPHSVNGLDYAPAVATERDIPLVTDVVDFDATEGVISVTREQYGGKIAAAYDVEGDEIALTLRPAEWEAAEPGAGDATIESVTVDIDEAAIGAQVSGYEEVEGGDIDITQADVLVSIGRGIEEEDNLPLIEALAESMGAVVSASRPIVDNGWLPRDRQVGQSGQTVTPDVYIAIGISGAVQHVSGMKGAETIVAINNDPNAPIFDIADYGIIGDLFDVVPELVEEFGGENPL